MDAKENQSLQDRYAPASRCFGCGPANELGLRIKSHPSGNGVGEVLAEWTPSPQHEAFAGVLSGGIIGTLLDCHSNWAAAYHLMTQAAAETPPCTVTAHYEVTLARPTPSDGAVTLRAKVVHASDDRAFVESSLEVGGKVCARCRGTFVAVKPGHPAYHRW